MDDHSPMAGEVTLNAGQLGDRLQLAMAARQQLLERGTVDRHFIRASMEAYGLEMPPHMPPNAFTAHPSTVNYAEAVLKIEDKVTHLQVQLLERLKQEYAAIYDDVMAHYNSAVADRGGHEQRFRLNALYLSKVDLHAAASSECLLVQNELTKMADMLTSWEGLNELGATILSEESDLYRHIAKATSLVAAALDRRLALSDMELGELQDATQAVVGQVRVLRHAEMANVPTPKWLAEQVIQLSQSLNFGRVSGIGLSRLHPLTDEDTMVSVVGTQLTVLKELQAYYKALCEIDDLVDAAIVRAHEISRSVGLIATLMA